MTFRLEGFEELNRALEQVAKRSTQIAITRRALKQAAEPMRATAERLAPNDTGQLKSQIAIGVRAKGEVGRAAYAATMKSGGDEKSALAAMRSARRAFKAINPPAIMYLGPTQEAWYAHFVEFGTGDHINKGRFAGTEHPGTDPRPFLRPAFDAEAKATIDRIAPLIWDEVQKNAARMAKRAAKAKG